MVEVVARLLLAAVLLVAAGLKLARPRQSAMAMDVYGARASSLQWLLWGVAIAAELALAIGVAAGSETAAYLAAAMMVFFALLMVSAIMAGRAGSNCACFGAASTLGWSSVGRNLVLAAGFALLPQLPQSSPSTEQWLALGVIVAITGVIALAVAVFALAREIGMLRLRLPPSADSALEIPEEGPPLGERVQWEPWGGGDGGSRDGRIPGTSTAGRGHAVGEMRLAVFLSEGCHVCRGLEPQVERFGRDPRLRTEIFDEVADSAAWLAFDVPGSPYAVACELDGTVLAKGSFNTLAQLESVLAAAERRRAAIAATIPGA